MPFELTKQYLKALRKSVESSNEEHLHELLKELHPADIADVLDELDLHDAQVVYQLLEEERASEVLVHLEDDVRDKFLASLSSREIAEQLIDNLESDDAADVLSDLPDAQKVEVINLLEDKEQASDLVDLLNYQEGTAGALMGKEFISVNKSWTVLHCVKEMRRQAEQLDYVYTVYVTDDQEKLIGTLSIKKLLVTPSTTPIEQIYKPNVISVTTDEDEEDVANIMEKYDLVVLPVVDFRGTLVGRITIDDVVDVIKEEAEKDYQLASGISKDVESTDSVWRLTRARLPWLLVGMAGGVLGAKVIGIFDLHANIEMALFIPLIAAMGGNVGVQSSAIIVQGLANKSLGMDSMFQRLVKELGVALINGVICSAIIFLVGILLGYSTALSTTVSISLLTVIVFAALFGTFIPLALNKYRIDPALATGPFITTVNDILGLFIYFMIGQAILGMA